MVPDIDIDLGRNAAAAVVVEVAPVLDRLTHIGRTIGKQRGDRSPEDIDGGRPGDGDDRTAFGAFPLVIGRNEDVETRAAIIDLSTAAAAADIRSEEHTSE